MFDGGEDLLDFVFRRGRAGDENQIVQTFFHDDLVSSCSGHWARENRLLPGDLMVRFRSPQEVAATLLRPAGRDGCTCSWRRRFPASESFPPRHPPWPPFRRPL